MLNILYSWDIIIGITNTISITVIKMARRPAPRGPARPALTPRHRPLSQRCYFNSPRCVCISNTLFPANILLFSSNANGTGHYVNPTLKYLSLWKRCYPTPVPPPPHPLRGRGPAPPGCDARHASPRRHLGLRGRVRAAEGGAGIDGGGAYGRSFGRGAEGGGHPGRAWAWPLGGLRAAGGERQQHNAWRPSAGGVTAGGGARVLTSGWPRSHPHAARRCK